MIKKNKQLFIFFIILQLISVFSITAFAETAKASITASSSNINVGDSVVVTVKFTASSIGSVDAILNYDINIIQFVSINTDTSSGLINASGVAGVLTLSGVANKAITSLSFPLTFKAKKSGAAMVKLTETEIYALDESPLGSPITSINLSVKDKSASTNANLKSFVISTGTLSPSFQPSLTEYKVTVPYETEKVLIDAKAEDSSATIKVSAVKPLVVGSNNTRTVTVTAPSGAVKTYTLTIIKQDKTSSTSSDTSSLPDSGSLEEFPIEINSVNYRLVSDLTNINPPGVPFIPDTITVDGASIAVYKHQNADITLVYLLNEENTGTFFIFDSNKNSYSAFISVLSGSNLYVLTKAPSEPTYQNFKKATVTIGGNEVEAWNRQIDGKPSDFYLLYAVNPEGQSGWYQYDSKEMTLQRSTEDLNDTVIKSLQKELEQLKGLKIISYVSIAVLALIIVLLVILLLQNKQKNSDYTPRHIRKD